MAGDVENRCSQRCHALTTTYLTCPELSSAAPSAPVGRPHQGGHSPACVLANFDRAGWLPTQVPTRVKTHLLAGHLSTVSLWGRERGPNPGKATRPFCPTCSKQMITREALLMRLSSHCSAEPGCSEPCKLYNLDSHSIPHTVS